MPRGGARPGAGRKKKTSVEEQTLRRELVHEVFTPDEWRAILVSWRDQGHNDIAKIYPLLPYLMGSAKQEVEHSQREPFKIVIETVPDRGSPSDG